jgi:hypothetical protein
MKNHLTLPQLFLRTAALALLCLCPASASAQLPDDANAPAPLAVRPDRVITKPASAPVNDSLSALRTGRTIYVKSSSLLVGAEVVEDKLQKRAEFSQLGLAITRDDLSADIILELHHDVFTKYVYTAIDSRTNIVLATGKLSSLGGTVAGKVAKRFLKQVMKARATAPGS